LDEAGEIVAMIDVFVRPPSESWSSRVNLLSLPTPKDSVTWHLLVKSDVCSVLASLKPDLLPMIRHCFSKISIGL